VLPSDWRPVHVRLLFSEPVGWLRTTNFTWALEPTLSWNQLHSQCPVAGSWV